MQESKDIQPDALIVALRTGCGLMQESKDIQQTKEVADAYMSCGLMQESKDIQPLVNQVALLEVVV